MPNTWLRTAATFVLVPLGAVAGEGVPPGWAEVAVIFTERCVMCHSEVAGASKGLRLDDYSAALAGSDTATARRWSGRASFIIRPVN